MKIAIIYLFRFSLIILLFSALYRNENMPISLFINKELWLWFGTGIVAFFAFVKITISKSFIYAVDILDLSVLLFLIILPIIFIYFGLTPNNNSILNTLALGTTYISVKILIVDIRPSILAKNVFLTLIITLFIQIFIATCQSFGFFIIYNTKLQISGSYFNTGPFAIYVGALTMFAFALLFINVLRKKWLHVIIQGVICAISIYFIFSSFSRSAWLGSIAGLTTGILAYMHSQYHLRVRKFNYKSLSILIALTCTTIPVLYWLYNIKEASATGRILIWKSCVQMLKDHWHTGVGFGNFDVEYINYQAKFFNINSAENIKKYGNLAGDTRFAFNDILQISCENGIFMGLFFLFILGLVTKTFISIIKKHNPSKCTVIFAISIYSTLCVIVVAGLTSYPLTIIPISLLFWLLVAILNSIKKHTDLTKGRWKIPLKLISALVLVLISIAFLKYSITMYYDIQEWTEIKKVPNNNLKTKRMMVLYKGLKTNANYLNDLAICHMNDSKYYEAISYLEKTVKISPNKIFYFNLGKCYENVGNYNLASKQYMLIQKAIPNLLKPRYLLAKLEYKKGDYKKFKILAMNTIQFQPKINTYEVVKMREDLKYLILTIDKPVRNRMTRILPMPVNNQ